MRVIVFLCCVIYTGAAATGEKCAGHVINGTYYDKQILKEGLDRPYQMIVDKKTNTLFFSFSVGDNQDDYFKSAFIDLDNNNTYGEINNIKDGFASAVDQETGNVYLGGSDGIYTFDSKNKSAVHAKARGRNMWVLFFKDKLYYIDYPSQKLYEYNLAEAEIVKEFEGITITQFAIDKHDERFFANATGLYGLQNGLSMQNITTYDVKVAIRGISLDVTGKVYFCGENGIYTLNEDKKFSHVVGISDSFGLAFDKDNHIIYATSNQIVRLKPSSKKC